jgi:hypothetical protein
MRAQSDPIPPRLSTLRTNLAVPGLGFGPNTLSFVCLPNKRGGRVTGERQLRWVGQRAGGGGFVPILRALVAIATSILARVSSQSCFARRRLLRNRPLM